MSESGAAAIRLVGSCRLSVNNGRCEATDEAGKLPDAARLAGRCLAGRGVARTVLACLHVPDSGAATAGRTADTDQHLKRDLMTETDDR